jgi:hypothetical protein
MRNLINISTNEYVVFLYPEDNKIIKSEAEFAKENILKSGWKSHLILKTWESIITDIESRLKSVTIKDYYKNFSQKYLKYK